jgi:hypothetical protein
VQEQGTAETVISNRKAIAMDNRKVTLSTLWVFATFNYLYADVIALFDLFGSNKVGTGSAGAFHITPEFLLASAVFMEIPIAMVVLSRALKYRANRWTNIVAGALETMVVLFLTFIMPLLNGASTPYYYLFFGTIEILCTSFIVLYAWKWLEQQA